MMGIVIAAVVVIADQLSKLLIQNVTALQDVEIIRDFFYLTYVKNTGAAWSLFSDMTGVLTLISAVAVGVMLWYIITKKPKGLTLVAVALMAGGAAGNMIDRLFLQYVRDFLHFYIADTCKSYLCAANVVFTVYSDNVRRSAAVGTGFCIWNLVHNSAPECGSRRTSCGYSEVLVVTYPQCCGISRGKSVKPDIILIICGSGFTSCSNA